MTISGFVLFIIIIIMFPAFLAGRKTKEWDNEDKQ